MKKIIVVFSVVVLSTSLFAQTKESFKPIGKMHFKVYWNYHTDFSSNKIQKNAFEIKRSYFGYKYAFMMLEKILEVVLIRLI